MTIAVVFEFPDADVKDYERVFELGGRPILDQPRRLSHVCYRTGETGFTVVDVWADEESFAAFGAVIGPVMAEIGLDGQPRVHPVHATVDQAGTHTHY